MRFFNPIIFLILISIGINIDLVAQNVVVNSAQKYVKIGVGDVEFLPPKSFNALENIIQSNYSATTFVSSKDFDAQITIMSKVLPKEVSMSYNNSNTQAPEGVVKSVPYTTIFGESHLHYSKVSILPNAASHEFNTVINTPSALLMILCYTHSGDQEKIDELVEVLISAFETLRVVE